MTEIINCCIMDMGEIMKKKILITVFIILGFIIVFILFMIAVMALSFDKIIPTIAEQTADVIASSVAEGVIEGGKQAADAFVSDAIGQLTGIIRPYIN